MRLGDGDGDGACEACALRPYAHRCSGVLVANTCSPVWRPVCVLSDLDEMLFLSIRKIRARRTVQCDLIRGSITIF